VPLEPHVAQVRASSRKALDVRVVAEEALALAPVVEPELLGAHFPVVASTVSATSSTERWPKWR